MTKPHVLVICALLVMVGCASNEASTATSVSNASTATIAATSADTPAAETTSPELDPFGGNDPEDHLMPFVVCMGLQEAQDEIQDHGVFFSRSEDATGQGRSQLIDSNWQVVAQSPDPGAAISEGDAVLQVVKYGEQPNPC